MIIYPATWTHLQPSCSEFFTIGNLQCIFWLSYFWSLICYHSVSVATFGTLQREQQISKLVRQPWLRLWPCFSHTCFHSRCYTSLWNILELIWVSNLQAIEQKVTHRSSVQAKKVILSIKLIMKAKTYKFKKQRTGSAA